MSGIKAKSGKKNRKHGNNKMFCERYESEGRREKNKARRQATHLRRAEKHDVRLLKRYESGKPVPGRFLKRMGLVNNTVGVG